jgi:hypothetical protein
MNEALRTEVQAIYESIGRRPPSLTWAKLEIGLGLGAIAGAIAFARAFDAVLLPPLLAALGAYLALAGHRTHLYSAMTLQSAALLCRSRAAGQEPEVTRR